MRAELAEMVGTTGYPVLGPIHGERYASECGGRQGSPRTSRYWNNMLAPLVESLESQWAAGPRLWSGTQNHQPTHFALGR